MTSKRKNMREGANMPDGLDPNSEISRKLRAVYHEVESEDIPEQFLDLLEKLDEAERTQNGGSKE